VFFRGFATVGVEAIDALQHGDSRRDRGVRGVFLGSATAWKEQGMLEDKTFGWKGHGR
jgi:hypothetical protein